MTIDLEDFGLTFAQQNEIELAHSGRPEEVERLIKKSKGANNPAAALIAMVRKIGAVVDVIAEPAIDLDGATNDCLRIYNARVAKYPPVDENGWREADAIIYAVDCVRHASSRFEAIDLERALRIRIGRPWTANEDPGQRDPGGCPPEILSNIIEKSQRIGAMPEGKTHAEYLADFLHSTGRVEVNPPRVNAPEPLPVTPEPTLAERLLAMTGKAA